MVAKLLAVSPMSSGRQSPSALPVTVLRVYDELRARVGDPRTGITVPNLPAVQAEGRIDAFLLGALRAAEAPPRR